LINSLPADSLLIDDLPTESLLAEDLPAGNLLTDSLPANGLLFNAEIPFFKSNFRALEVPGGVSVPIRSIQSLCSI